MRTVHGILWCADNHQAQWCQNYGSNDGAALNLIRQRYLSAVCAAEWWPIELAPFELAGKVVGWACIRPTVFKPVYFEDKLVALLLALGDKNE